MTSSTRHGKLVVGVLDLVVGAVVGRSAGDLRPRVPEIRRPLADLALQLSDAHRETSWICEPLRLVRSVFVCKIPLLFIDMPTAGPVMSGWIGMFISYQGSGLVGSDFLGGSTPEKGSATFVHPGFSVTVDRAFPHSAFPHRAFQHRTVQKVNPKRTFNAYSTKIRQFTRLVSPRTRRSSHPVGQTRDTSAV